MIIASTPLRISLLGGSTDLEDFIEFNGDGKVISFPIPCPLLDAVRKTKAMSLKDFHIFFILISVILAIFFGGWCVKQGGVMYLVSGIVSFLVGIGLVVYLLLFVKKTRKIQNPGEPS